MSKEVLIFMHTEEDAPGYFEKFLQHRSIPYRLIHSYKDEIIPQLDDSIAGLVFMGGSMSVNDDIDWISTEIALIKQALSSGIPIIGHCLGGQLISKALGQKVVKNSVDELGWHPCFRIDENRSDWLTNIPDTFMMFHWHNETFTIPPEGKPLFSSEFCKNQAYSYGDNVLAMQCHVEITEPLLRDWVERHQHHLNKTSSSEQNGEQMLKPVVENVRALNQIAEQLYIRWLKTVSL